MADMGPPLPQNCAACVYYPTGKTCQRHAPSPGTEAFELVYWPRVKPADRCGSGAAVGNGDEPDAPGVVACQACIHWYQPGGAGIKPDYRQGRPVEWWASSGYCTRFAPSPSSENDRKTMWRVTSAIEGCGDGQVVQQDEDEDGGDLTPTDVAHSTSRVPGRVEPLPALP